MTKTLKKNDIKSKNVREVLLSKLRGEKNEGKSVTKLYERNEKI